MGIFFSPLPSPPLKKNKKEKIPSIRPSCIELKNQNFCRLFFFERKFHWLCLQTVFDAFFIYSYIFGGLSPRIFPPKVKNSKDLFSVDKKKWSNSG